MGKSKNMTPLNKSHFNFKDRKGEKFTTNEGYVVEIINYNSYHNCDIIFEDDTEIKQVSINKLNKGEIIKPVSRVGEKYVTTEGFEIEIIEYISCNDCTILFNKSETRFNLRYGHVKSGKVKNYIFPQIYGVGYIGYGKYNTYSKIGNVRIYNRWLHILKRCYDDKTLKRKPTYIGCTVDERWYNFQVFAEWFEENWESHMDSSWEIDKDWLFKGNKIYSPETCCFVPKEINTIITKRGANRGDLPIGVIKKINRYQALISINGEPKNLGSFLTIQEAFNAYKFAKETQIKELAYKYKGKISKKCYQAMHLYIVEITD